MAEILQTESRIQQEIFREYNNSYCLANHNPRCLILAIPNGGNRTAGEAMASKAVGEYKGAADLLVIHYGKVLFVEVKTPVGIQSKEQKGFHEHVSSMGFSYHLVRSLLDFQLLISSLS